ncbi:MAG TPA: cysteine--tRNA ligase [Longimicrobiales bacterium]|nr:cysteine--tRNA ligase [Longimicrobiales bacterium]
MTLTLHNSMSRSDEAFHPSEGDEVRVYACGPTIYAHAHIGNFRSFAVYDLFHRCLAWKGWTPKFVLNLTDVDDKTIRGAREAGVGLREFTEPFETAFRSDLETLGFRPFTAMPRATEHVDEMIAWIERLEANGLAYPADDGSVYFRISAFDAYGALSGNRADGETGRSRIDADEYEKDDIRDFVLWKAAKEEDRAVGAVWDSPWGEGRPGWHLECSVLSCTELGETLDVHLGGEDLLFPHHENEIAQSEGATGRTFSRFWLHTKHLRVEGRKMAKSLGNTYTIEDLLEKGYRPSSIRHLLLSAHYRKELNFTFDGLEASARAVQRLLGLDRRLEELDTQEGATDAGLDTLAETALADFEAALDDDLNSSEALSALFVFLSGVNGALDEVGGGPVSPSARQAAQNALHRMDEIFGLLPLARAETTAGDDLADWVESKLAERKAAREAKEWARADAIRDEITDRGIILEDTPQGTRWSVGG